MKVNKVNQLNPQKVLLTGFSNYYIRTNHKADHNKTGLLLDEVTLTYVHFSKMCLSCKIKKTHTLSDYVPFV